MGVVVSVRPALLGCSGMLGAGVQALGALVPVAAAQFVEAQGWVVGGGVGVAPGVEGFVAFGHAATGFVAVAFGVPCLAEQSVDVGLWQVLGDVAEALAGVAVGVLAQVAIEFVLGDFGGDFVVGGTLAQGAPGVGEVGFARFAEDLGAALAAADDGDDAVEVANGAE